MTAARTLYVVPLAGLVVVLGGSCAGTKSAPSPAEQTKAAEEQTHRAFSQAAEAQQKAAEQEKRVAEVHREVVETQQQLSQLQVKEEQERLRAQQLKQQADQQLQVASQHAQQAQTSAARGAQGTQMITGQVTQATSSQIVVRTEGGRVMTFNVEPQTKVLVGGEERSAAEIQQGANAMVSYEAGEGGQQNAVTIQVSPAGAPGEP
jgi:hypothetical protein